jgi:cell surface protein SprA
MATIMSSAEPGMHPHFIQEIVLQDTIVQDSLRADTLDTHYEPSRQPTFIPSDRFGDPFIFQPSVSPLILKDPSNLQMDIDIDTANNYIIYEKVGETNYRPISTMTFEEFQKYQEERMIKEYWRNRSVGLDGESAVSGRRLIPPIYISPVFDRIFGGSYVDIRPNGYVNLDFGARYQRIDNPAIPIKQQRNGGFEFDQQISMNVVGKIGEKLAVTANFDNNNSFDFQNNLKVEYTGFEEEIIKKIEVGNVSLPLKNSLITGAQNLFGLKTQLQFGKLFVTAVASTQRGKNEVLTIQGGSEGQGREFQLRASDYDERRHFFLGHFFRDNYERWLGSLPQVLSGVNITRIEVYVINRNNNTQTLRNFLGMMDMGEGKVIYQEDNSYIGPGKGNVPSSNNANNLFSSLQADPDIRSVDNTGNILENEWDLVKGTDFEVITSARKLDDNEYTFHPLLGYISLKRKLQNDEVLAVSFEYTYNGVRYKVGELTEDYQNVSEDQVIYLKLLRPSKINPTVPTWDLMIKHIYNLNASQINSEGFDLRIIYRDDKTGIDNPSLHEGRNTKDIPLVQLFNLDRLNRNNDPQKDGVFDYVEGVTIDPDIGTIIFTVLEPFGSFLESKFDPDEQALIEKYVYDTLYRTTKADAELLTRKNKFVLIGTVTGGSSTEIILPGINISEGSVQVIAGSIPLSEGIDYRVDYNLGKVSIINQSVLNSGKPIQIKYEKADLFNFQARTLLGGRFDYIHDDKFNIGGTILYLNERPLVSRISVGDETIRNTKWGLDFNYRTESNFLTKMVDFLPLVSTKEPSMVSLNGEVAQILPGTSNIVDGKGTSYIDDFESAITPFRLGGNVLAWKLAATPKSDDGYYDGGNQQANDLSINYKRAKLSWYIIDNVFYRTSGSSKPPNLTEQDLQNNYSRAVIPQEIFKFRDREVVNTNLPVFDLAYYPSERGSYNYNPNLQSDGTLPNPQQNWGGITRAITSDVDFDQTNIEYLEFWLMDPFINSTNGVLNDPNGLIDDGINPPGPNTTGGKLIFHLGSISEDVMKDNRHAFENGLPADGDTTRTTNNAWGRVTQEQYLTNAFDNSESARPNQDVGLDGVINNDEANYFSDFIDNINVSGAALDNILNDVSADNFQYFLGPELDESDAKILERYKEYNLTDGNSPLLIGTADYTPVGTTFPDNEDINFDNTLSDLEEYYEYELDLRPGNLEVGKNYVTEVITNEINGQRVNWYLIRIPILKPSRVQGNIIGFKSIRFIRSIMTDWREPAVLRMVKFQLVGAQWRRYTLSLRDKYLMEPPEVYNSNFTFSVVNIEENGSPAEGETPYVLPPGIEQDIDNTSPIYRRTNEQSIKLTVEDLQDGDARGVFKNTAYNLVNYGRIKMFFHAQNNGNPGDSATAFLRIGTDLVDNYYEIEVPLVFTPRGSTDPQIIWPEENNIDLEFTDLYALKKSRDNSEFNINIPYSQQTGRYKITVVGRPDISAVETMMIGMRNPKTPDGDPVSFHIWANELRVTDFNNNPGWAANARFDAKLADFATVNADFRYSSVGFGAIQQRISERTREEILNYDVSANIALDKFIPEKVGLKIPMYVSYEERKITPNYDPLDPDVPLDATLKTFDDPAERDNYSKIVQDVTTRKSINFTNVRKVKTKENAKSHIYDIENFSFTYASSTALQRTIYKQEYINRFLRIGLAYNWSSTPKTYEPFKNSKAFSSPWLQLIKDLNITPMVSNLGFRWDLNRRFVKEQLRNSDLTIEGILPTWEKSFYFDRNYNLRWNITKSISIDYMARVNAIVDEPEGDIDTQAKRDSIISNLKRLGRMKNFNQDISLTYRIPVDKTPLTDWINSDFRYRVGYTWMAGATDQADTLGNTVQNNRDWGLNGKFDLVKIYNKSNLLKEINSPRRSTRRPATTPPTQTDTTEVQKREHKFGKGFLRFLMMLRSVNFSYTNRQGTILPGYTPSVFLFGMDSSFSAPGWDFIFGSQSRDIQSRAVQNDWLASSEFLSYPFTQYNNIDLKLTGNIEPAPDLRIQLVANKLNSDNFHEIFRYTTDTLENGSFQLVPVQLAPTRTGSYSITVVTIGTSFVKDGADNVNETFKNFEEYRDIIRNRLNATNPSGEFDLNSQDVLIPSFLAAYQDKDPLTIPLTSFPKWPMPNWRLDYTGLGKIAGLRDVFSSVNITHAYSSTYSINNYANSLLYDSFINLDNTIEDTPPGFLQNENGDLIPVYVVSQAIISERFSPLIGLNLRTKSRLTARVEYKRERNLALNMSNAQITELSSKDFSVDVGWTKTKLKLPIKFGGNTIVLDNDIQFRINFTIRDTKTVQRKINETNTITQGNINFQLRPTIQYTINQRLNMTFYFERNINEPLISSSFKRATTSFGTQIRFSLAQ